MNFGPAQASPVSAPGPLAPPPGLSWSIFPAGQPEVHIGLVQVIAGQQEPILGSVRPKNAAHCEPTGSVDAAAFYTFGVSSNAGRRVAPEHAGLSPAAPANSP